MRAIGRLTARACVFALVLLMATATFGPPTHADGPNAVFQGFVVTEPFGVPVRVRAASADGTVCGTADVQTSGDGVGFYTLSAVTAASKVGCPPAGGLLRFTLVYGRIDEGVAVASAVLTPGIVSLLHLFEARDGARIGGFEGTPPPAGGRALLRWTGPDRTPIEQAIVTLSFPVDALSRYNPSTGQYDVYAPGPSGWGATDAILSAGDEVIVERAR